MAPFLPFPARAAVLAAALVAAACGPRPSGSGEGHGVLVIAVEALRADHLSCYGYDRPTTPTLDELAAEGTLFLQSFTAMPEILPAHGALLTGCDPNLLRRPPLPDGSELTPLTSWYLPDEVPRLSQAFLAAGYRTAAFVDQYRLDPVFGFAAGFESFERVLNPEEGITRGFPAVATRFTRWLQSVDSDADWFAYVNLNDLDRLWRWTPPDPKWDSFFEPRPELGWVPPVAEARHSFFAIPRLRWAGGTRTLGEYEARYDGALRRLDAQLARLFGHLERMGRWEDLTVAIVGTYGVGFGDSGLILDSGTLAMADLHVPWIVRPAPRLGALRGQRSEHLASLIDVAPTLLDLAGLAAPPGTHGVSQGPVVRAGEGPRRALAFASGGLQDGFVTLDDRWCYEWSTVAEEQSGPLTFSWYGAQVSGAQSHRPLLYERRAVQALPLHEAAPLLASTGPPELQAELHAAGEEWLDAVRRARDVLHRVPWREASVDPAEVAELRRRGLIGTYAPAER